MTQRHRRAIVGAGAIILLACSEMGAPPAATKLTFTVQPSNATADSLITPAVAVAIEDASDNVVTTATDVVTLALGAGSGGGALAGTTSVTAVNGVATFSALSINKAGTAYTLTAAAPGLATATSAAFDVAVAPARLVFTVEPSNSNAGTAIAPAVQVTAQDSAGNTAPGFTGVVSLAIGTNPGSGTLGGTMSATAVKGVATFSALSINKPGTGYTLMAAAPGLPAATSATFDVALGPAARLAFVVQPSNTNVGATIAPAVQVAAQDAGGNTVTTFTGNVAIAIGTNPAGGTLSGTTPVQAVAGVATFSDLSIPNAGTGYTLNATSGPLTAAASTPFTIAFAPTTLHITTATTGAALPSGYYLCVDFISISYGCDWQGTIGVNSAVTVPVATGSHSVELEYVPGNCAVSGANPRVVTASGVTEVPFSVSCLDTGSVHITIVTTGTDIDPNGYVVCVNSSGNNCFWSVGVHANDLITISAVTAGPHTVSVAAVAGNCTVSGGAARAVTVPVHGTVAVAFNVACVLAERIAFSYFGTITVIRVDSLATESITHGFAPAWSPDGMRLAYECGLDICTINADRTGLAQLTMDGAGNHHPTWSPTGSQIAFAATHGGVSDLWVMAANGSGAVQLTHSVGFLGSPSWSPDGTKIAFDCQVDPGNDDICVVNADGTGLVRLTSDPARDYGVAWKPDGSTLAFATTRYGGNEIVLMSPAGGGVSRIGTGLSGFEPAWSPDGTQLTFVQVDQYGNRRIAVAHADGSNIVLLTVGDQPAWKPHP